MAQHRDRRVVAGLFPDIRSARAVVTELKAVGFTNKEIGLAMTNPTENATSTETVTDTRAAEEATTGAVGGGVLGGLTGLLIAAGVVAIPGLGALLAGGVLASALGVTGASVVAGTGLGAAAGGLVGGLIGFDIPESEARHFESRYSLRSRYRSGPYQRTSRGSADHFATPPRRYRRRRETVFAGGLRRHSDLVDSWARSCDLKHWGH
jgi:hypothetical protein